MTPGNIRGVNTIIYLRADMFIAICERRDPWCTPDSETRNERDLFLGRASCVTYVIFIAKIIGKEILYVFTVRKF